MYDSKFNTEKIKALFLNIIIDILLAFPIQGQGNKDIPHS
jgi:hypothetical protein